MMSKTSLNKKNITLNMFIETLRKNIGIIILMTVGVLMICPGYVSVYIKDNILSIKTDDSLITNIIEAIGISSTVISGLAVILFNLINFMFMYKKPSCDVYFSLPLKRYQLILSRCFAGFIFVLIPVLVCFVSLIGIVGYYSYLSNNISAILVYFLYTVITMLVCSSFSMIFVVTAGTSFDLILSFATFNIGIVALPFIIEIFLSDMLIGYCGNAANIIRYVSPLAYCFMSLSHHFDNNTSFSAYDVKFIIAGLVLSIIFTVISVVLFKKRRVEKGGEAYAYRFIYIICSIIIGILASIIVGRIFDDGYNLFYWIFALLGSAIGVVTYGAITDRGFKYIKKYIVLSLISYVIMAACLFSIFFNFFGFEKRIPEKEDVKTVKISVNDENVTFYNPELALSIHKKIVDSIEKGEYFESKPYEEYLPEDRVETEYIDFEYKLKNGSTLNRSYLINFEDYQNEMFEFYKSNERMFNITKSINNIKSKKVDLFYYNETSGDDADSFSAVITPDELKKTVEIYFDELKNANPSITYKFKYFVDISYEINNTGVYSNFRLKLDDSFNKTLDFLNVFKDREEVMLKE